MWQRRLAFLYQMGGTVLCEYNTVKLALLSIVLG